MSSTTHLSPAQLEIIGHEKRWAALARAFAKGQTPETLLISGPAHVGKSTLALRYAQLLLCPDLKNIQNTPDMSTHAASHEARLPFPCGACRVCHQVEVETFPDYRVYRPVVKSESDERNWIVAPGALEGSLIPMKMARLFGDEAMRRPSIGARKVMVMQQAERMEHDAQNSLLKTFEEPAQGLSIVLLCDNPDELLSTVLSRAWHLPLSLVPDRIIQEWLHLKFSDAPAQWIEEAVRVARGRPGMAWREMRRLARHNNATGSDGAGSDGASRAAKGASGVTTSGAAAKAVAKNSDAGEAALPRFAQAARLVARIMASQPVGALGLTEEALRLARLWWDEDQAEEAARDNKKGDAKVTRSALARFLDELATAYRARWMQAQAAKNNSTTKDSAQNGARRSDAEASRWADGLDLIRKTRHYILRNANSNLALDVMFGRLIAAWSDSTGASQAPASREAVRARSR